MKAYSLKLGGELGELLEGKGLGYDSLKRLFDNINSCTEKRSALAYLSGIRERVHKLILSSERWGEEPRYKGLSAKLKRFLIKIDTFMSEC